jgi:hypothetical protein
MAFVKTAVIKPRVCGDPERRSFRHEEAGPLLVEVPRWLELIEAAV